MTKDEKKELRKYYKDARKEYRRATRPRRIITTLVIVTILTTFFTMGFAQTIPSADVDEMKSQVENNDVAVLPDGAVLGDPNYVATWAPVIDDWVAGDNNRILYFGLSDAGFDAVAASHEGFEISKVQDCLVTGISGTTIDCTAPDGSIYAVENEYGLQLGDMVVLCFLLSAA